jgi:hypothetical protein
MQGECQANPPWMSCNCRLSCRTCNAAINYRDSLSMSKDSLHRIRYPIYPSPYSTNLVIFFKNALLSDRSGITVSIVLCSYYYITTAINQFNFWKWRIWGLSNPEHYFYIPQLIFSLLRQQTRMF